MRKGRNFSEIARITGFPRTTIRDWVAGKTPNFDAHSPTIDCNPGSCITGNVVTNTKNYVYLLGLYLGDGCISTSKKGIHRLRISCCNAYPEIMERCVDAMSSTIPRKVGFIRHSGWTEVYSDSKHWTCLFPQHGPGRKHERPIFLADWQQVLVDVDPRPLIAELIHLIAGLIRSDGCRVLNPVAGRLYPRYHFTNASDDIRKIFTDCLNVLGIPWTQKQPTQHLRRLA